MSGSDGQIAVARRSFGAAGPHHAHHHHHHHARPRSLGHSGRTPGASRTAEVLTLLGPLEFPDLLAIRQVCKDWNNAVCARDEGQGQGVTGTGLLWAKGRLYFDAAQTSGLGNRSKETVASQFEEFSKIHLIKDFKCPSYHFYLLDTQLGVVRKFFSDHSSDIKSLRLNNCTLTLSSFQEILQVCSSLETFEVSGMFHYNLSEGRQRPEKAERRIKGQIALRNLTFESTYVTKLLKRKRHQRHGHFEPAPALQDLHPTVIHTILLSAKRLETVVFKGFGLATVNTVMKTLATNPINSDLAHVQFFEIPNSAGSLKWTGDMTDLGHLKLKKFALTFLAEEAPANVALERDANSNLPERVGSPAAIAAALDNLDHVVRKVLLAHQKTLVSLDLRNCNVTEAILLPSEDLADVPALKHLRLQGTQIKGLSEKSKFLLRKFLEGEGPGVIPGGNGPIDRATVDQIIDEALFDAQGSSGAAEAGSSGASGAGPRGEPLKVGFCNCAKIDVICLAAIFVVIVVAIFYFLITWYGDSLGRVIILGSIATFLLLYLVFSVITNSLSD